MFLLPKGMMPLYENKSIAEHWYYTLTGLSTEHFSWVEEIQVASWSDRAN